MKNSDIKVKKYSGELATFDESRIRESASRVGVPAELQDDLVKHIKTKLYDGIPTKEIFHEIKNYLGAHNQQEFSTKYNLKSAILELGPSGYPFEKYIAQLLDKVGYSTSTNQELRGKCISHEIDVVASKKGETSLIEAKFHSKQSVKTDVKVVLYINSRFNDIQSGWTKESTVVPWIITNARFTSDAIDYGNCQSIKLTSWDYPSGDSFRELVEKLELHPVTILDTASRKYKNLLLANGIVTCRQFIESKNDVSRYIPAEDLDRMTKEATRVCSLS